MNVLAFDTATPATAVAFLASDGRAAERRHEPEPGERPGHAAQLLPLVEAALADAGATWDDVTRLAVGVGPGTFTGLRIGIATARALAQGRDLLLVGVSSLEALARPADAGAGGQPVLAVLDARRGEAFAAAWQAGRRVLDPAALAPPVLADATRALGGTPLAIGDGAVRFRDVLEAAAAAVPADDSPLHRISAMNHCHLAAGIDDAAALEAVLPTYLRVPDAEMTRRERP